MNTKPKSIFRIIKEKAKKAYCGENGREIYTRTSLQAFNLSLSKF